MKLGFAGKYQLESHKVDSDGNEISGSRRVVLPWFDNLITDAGIDSMCSLNVDNLTVCRIGVGNSAPAFSDVGLNSQSGVTSTDGLGSAYGVGAGAEFLYRRVSRRFAAGSVSGLNLAEVGMASAAGANLFSRALLTDAEGNPVAINLGPDEVLDVIYELRMYLPPVDTVINEVIDGVPTEITMRRTTNAAHLGDCAGRLGRGVAFAQTYGPGRYGAVGDAATLPAASDDFGSLRAAGGVYPFGTLTITPYVGGSGVVRFNLSYSLTQGNSASGALHYFLWSGSAGSGNAVQTRGAALSWVWGFNPPINKTAERLANVSFGLQVVRHTP